MQSDVSCFQPFIFSAPYRLTFQLIGRANFLLTPHRNYSVLPVGEGINPPALLHLTPFA